MKNKILSLIISMMLLSSCTVVDLADDKKVVENETNITETQTTADKLEKEESDNEDEESNHPSDNNDNDDTDVSGSSSPYGGPDYVSYGKRYDFGSFYASVSVDLDMERFYYVAELNEEFIREHPEREHVLKFNFLFARPVIFKWKNPFLPDYLEYFDSTGDTVNYPIYDEKGFPDLDGEYCFTTPRTITISYANAPEEDKQKLKDPYNYRITYELRVNWADEQWMKDYNCKDCGV